MAKPLRMEGCKVCGRWFLGNGLEALTAISMLLIIAIVLSAVVSRYIVGHQITWSEEVARLLLIWLAGIGGAVTMKRDGHSRVLLAVRWLPQGAQELFEIAANLAMLALFAVLLYESVGLTRVRASDVLPASELSAAWVMLPVPIGVGVMFLIVGRRLLRLSIRELREHGLWLLLGILVTTTLLVAFGGRIVAQNPLMVTLIGFGIVTLMGVPISFSMAAVSAVYLTMVGDIPLTIIPLKMVGGIDSFLLLAVPLFIVGGSLMETGGVSEPIVMLARALVGRIRGGLAQVVVVAEVIFSGISGSTTADVSAISALLIPAMVKAQYPRPEAVSIVSASTAMGILIPPCLNMVIIGGMVNLSVITMFMAGIVPGLLLAICLMILIYLKALRGGWPVDARASYREVGRAAVGAIIPMGMPLIIFVGILGGIMTITESAVVAVVYALLVGTLVYKELNLRIVMKNLVDSGAITGMVLWLVGAASTFSWILARQEVPRLLGEWVLSAGAGPTGFLVFTILVMITVGAVLEGLAALLILGPIFFPIAAGLGINPIHYAIVMVIASGVAFFVPPIGLGLFIACSVGKIDVEETIRPFAPYLAVLVGGMIAIGLAPWLSLVLPRALHLAVR